MTEPGRESTTNGAARHLPSDLALENVACNNCGSTRASVLAEGRDHEYPHTTAERFRMVRCDCGLVYLCPRPTAAELDRIYPPDYYAYQIVEQRLRESRGARGKTSRLRRFMEKRAIERLRAYTRLVSSDGPVRILDIGCGDGTVLNQWKKAFDVAVETHGVEMSDKAAAIAEAQGHVVMPKRIEECELARESYDLVYSFHVIEHVADPASFLRAVHGALKPSGLLLIETPNVDTADFRLFGPSGHWGAFHFPRHWTMYDGKTFRALAEKTGFEVTAIEYVPSAVFWVWSLHSALYARSPWLADRLFPPVDIMLRGSPWLWALMSFFTALDIANAKLLGRTACMRIQLRKA